MFPAGLRDEASEERFAISKYTKKMAWLPWAVLLLLWCGLLFYFSAQPGDISSQQSNSVGLLVGHIFVPDFASLSEAEQLSYVASISHSLRKLAHFGAFFMLGVLAMGLFSSLFRRPIWQLLAAFGVGLLYAATDEFHQLFVAGRSGQLSDVAIDSTGVLVGMLVFLLLRWLFCGRRNRAK